MSIMGFVVLGFGLGKTFGSKTTWENVVMSSVIIISGIILIIMGK